MITTRGFRDALEIGTQMRPRLYDLRQSRPGPIVPRDLRLEVGGRVDARGAVVEELPREEVEAVVDRLVELGVESIAIALVFSFLEPAHEQAVLAIVRERAPGLYAGCSAAISPEAREFPRFATAAVNAGLVPRLDPYIGTLEAALGATRLEVMQSNGGLSTAARSVGENAHRLLLSGPAAGVIGGALEAAAAGFARCVTVDVGGTSADIGVVPEGGPRSAITLDLPGGTPCSVPHIDVPTIGAGGGSIAWVDAGGGLQVGPRSAGAEPGPACYGRGGSAPTVTDAELVLGRFSPAGLIDGGLPLDEALARNAIAPLAAALGLEVEEAALGILAVVEENMAGAIRRSAARNGDDLRDFALVAGGGAGPLFAAALIRALGMSAAVIPLHPGLLSAFGLLAADLRHDLAAPVLHAPRSLGATLDRLAAEAADRLAEDGIPPGGRVIERSVDVRYAGQDHAIAVAASALDDVAARFHAAHEQTFGHGDHRAAIELVMARVVGIGRRPVPSVRARLPEAPVPPAGKRAVRFGRDGSIATPVHRRDALAAGEVLTGPAIIEQLDTTTVVPPGFAVRVTAAGALVLTETGE